mmetsp:Transcript_21162/g.59223  ORF Transcript_21162/g.59223 Transcript_21162/m.59223 type:complete len:230 (+) Transcript_21162:81-770(+)
MGARSVFDLQTAGRMAAGEDCKVTCTPFDREEGRSWRHADEGRRAGQFPLANFAGGFASTSHGTSELDSRAEDYRDEASPASLSGSSVIGGGGVARARAALLHSAGNVAAVDSASPSRRCSPQVFCAVALCPLGFAMLLARSTSCWLMLVPGLASISVPLCLWSAKEIGKLWLYWDGGVQLLEDWPALTIARTSAVALLFAASFGASLSFAVLVVWGSRYWSANGHCPG